MMPIILSDRKELAERELADAGYSRPGQTCCNDAIPRLDMQGIHLTSAALLILDGISFLTSEHG